MDTHKKTPSLFLSLLPIIFMMLTVYFGSLKNELSVPLMVLISTFFSMILGLMMGYTWQELQNAMYEKMGQSVGTMLTLLLVGGLIGSWIISGTIPMIVFYGAEWISPKYMILFAFITNAITSILTGSSWATIGTSGVAMYGIAIALGVPQAPVLGAIITGACLGDKISPISDNVVAITVATKVNIWDHVRSMLVTSIPAAVIAVGFFTYLGFITPEPEVVVDNILLPLKEIWNFNIFLIIPFILVLTLSFFKKPVIMILASGIGTALIISFFTQDFSIADSIRTLTEGFSLNYLETVPELNKEIVYLVERGGMQSMFTPVLIALFAMAFGGVLEKCGFIKGIAESIVVVVKDRLGLTIMAVISCLIFMSLSSSVLFAMVMTGYLLSSLSEEYGITSEEFSRILADSTVMFLPIIPWSDSALFINSLFGVTPEVFAPYLIITYLCLFFSLLGGLSDYIPVLRCFRKTSFSPRSS